MGLVLKNATVVDTVGRVVTPASVRIEDGRIAAVGEATVQGNDELVDCEGRFAIPGLMDMHIHLRGSGEKGPMLDGAERPAPTAPQEDRERLSRLHSYLYCGVTSLYDAGNDPDVLLPLRRAERAGKILAPRIFCTGSLVTCPGGHAWQLGHARQITSLPADLPILEEFLLDDPDIVKITYDEHNWGVRPLIPILSPRTLRQIISFCHERMRRVTVHASSELRAREAVDAGADTLAHPVIQSPASDPFLWLLAQRQLPVVSTLAIGERYARLGKHPEFLDEEPYRTCLSEREREHLRTVESERQRGDRWAAWMEVMTPVAQENLRRLVEAGGTIVTGTDLSLGPDYLRELELLQDAGIEPWDVLRAATHNGGIFLDRRNELGDIAPGRTADIVLLDADPTEDVRRLSQIWRVYKGGEPIDRDALELPGARAGRS
ncbi:MAG: amidohydrolase family protein [Solirubrobacteraceae bacterium]